MTLKRKNAVSRFDNWDDVNICNHCEHYWNSTCDAVNKPCQNSNENTAQSEKQTVCKAFTPTRRETYEQDIKTLQKGYNSLWWALMILAWALGGSWIWFFMVNN